MGGTGRIPRPVGAGEFPGGRILGQEKKNLKKPGHQGFPLLGGKNLGEK